MNLRLWKLVLVALAALPCLAQAQTFIREELRIPAPGAGSRGLEAILVRPSVPERLPLVVITHGSALKREEWRAASPLAYLPQATEFARRGWATAIVMRRGFGDSGGDYAAAPGPCTNPNYVASATTDTIDLRAGIAHLRKRPDIDGARLLVVGQSSGGLAAVALTADPPSGLLAAINFAGGKIATRASEACKGTEDRLVEAFNTFGKRSRTPMLWIYSENDKVFPPELAERFKDAFSAGGGNVEFIKAMPFRTDGHNLFSSTGSSYWAPYVDRFLAKQNLVLRDIPLPLPPPPDIAPPDQLSAGGRRSFDEFLRSPPHRAFAVSSNGAYGWNSGRRTAEEATKRAIESCSKHANDCVIVVVDENAVR